MGDEFAAMFVSEISLWGAAIVACVVLVAAIVSDRRLVGLSAMVLAGIGVVDMLVSVSFAVDMEENVAARQCSDARR
jgi:hypothetical protein